MHFIAEEIARAFLLATKVSIESALVAADARMSSNDAEWFAAMDMVPQDTELKLPTKYHVNLIPETLKKPIAEFPNVSVVTQMSSSTGENADQMETAQYSVAVEAFVASRDADEAARLVSRYANALLAIAENDPTLQGLVAPLAHQPTITISSVVARRESTTTDVVIYMQGCRLDLTYVVDGSWKIN